MTASPLGPADRDRWSTRGLRWRRERVSETGLAERYRTDMVTFTPGPYDVRVARGGWVLYVRAVRGTERLLGPRVLRVGSVVSVLLGQVVLRLPPPWAATALAVAVVVPVVVGLARRRRVRDRPWEVGVVRGPDPAGWHAGPPVVEHTEELGRGEDPRRRVAELADDCRAGRFDPA